MLVNIVSQTHMLARFAMNSNISQHFRFWLPFWMKHLSCSEDIVRGSGLTGPQLLEPGCWEKGGDFFQVGGGGGGLQF